MDSYKLTRIASWVLVLVAVSSLYSMICLSQIDSIVNRDLYNYDLRFDFRWATPYWAIINVVFVLGWFNVIAAVAFQLYSFAHRRRKAENVIAEDPSMESLRLAEQKGLAAPMSRNRKIAYFLLALGLVALSISLFYSSSALAFAGLGLTFWGALLLYIAPAQQVSVKLMNAMMFSVLINIEQLMPNTARSQKGIYLPPKYLNDQKASLIFIPSKPGQTLPEPVGLHDAHTDGVFLTPPGTELSQLFEKEFRKPFTETDFSHLQERLPRILVEDLGIARNMNLSKEGNTITAEITDHILIDICRETRKLQKTHMLTGCPLCSAIACALTKTTGSPLTIENENQSQDGKSTKVQFKLMDHESKISAT